MTINKEKFIFASSHVHFCGFDIDAEGIQADPAEIKAIAKFHTPESLTDLRSFFGLVNQLANFTPNISDAAETLRPLLSPRRCFVWTQDHEEAFQRVKESLVSTLTLRSFRSETTQSITN